MACDDLHEIFDAQDAHVILIHVGIKNMKQFDAEMECEAKDYLIQVDIPNYIAPPTELIKSIDFENIYKGECNYMYEREDIEDRDYFIPKTIGIIVPKPIRNNIRFCYGPNMVKHR